MECLSLFVSMVLQSFYDIKNKEISFHLLILSALIVVSGAAMKFVWAEPSAERIRVIMTVLLGAVPGALLIALSFYTNKIGRGDGMVVTLIGMSESCTFAAVMMCLACLMLSAVSVFLMLMHKATKNTRMPYIPFVTLAYVIIKFNMTGVFV